MRSLGLSIQPDGFSFTLLDGSSKKFSVAATGSGHIDWSASDPVKDLGRRVSAALKAVGAAKHDRMIVAMPSVDSVQRELSLPFVERDKVMQVLKFEIESDLYHHDIDDVVCDFIELHDERATSTLLVAAAAKDSIRTVLEALAGGGLDAPILDLDYGVLACVPGALDQLAPPEEVAEGDAPVEPPSDPTLPEIRGLLKVGPYSSILQLHSDGGLRSSRTLHLGWRELGRGLTRAADGVPEVDAEAVVEGADLDAAHAAEEVAMEAIHQLSDEEAAVADPDHVEVQALFGVDAELPVEIDAADLLPQVAGADLQAFLGRLVAEVRRGLLAASLEMSRLDLVGPEIPGLTELLHARLGVPVYQRHLDDGTDAVSAGAALRGLGDKVSPMNLRQEEFRYTKGLERIEGPLTFALVGLIAFLVLDGVIHFKRGQALMTAAASLDPATGSLLLRAQNKVDEMLNQSLPPDADDSWLVRTNFEGLKNITRDDHIVRLAGAVDTASRDLDELIGTGDVEIPSSGLIAWRLVMDLLSKELDGRSNRWMLEGLTLTSVDKKSRRDAHVQCDVRVTIMGSTVDATRLGDALASAFNNTPWSIAPVTNSGWEPSEEGEGRTATLTIYCSPEKAKEIES